MEKIFENKEFHGKVTFFGQVIFDPVSVLGIIKLADGSAGTPSLTFASDLDTGFFWSVADTIGVTLNGIHRWAFTKSTFVSADSGGIYLRRAAGSSTVPIFTNTDDIDTGIGYAGADQLSLIAGGVEGARITTNEVILPTPITLNGRATHTMFDDFIMKAFNGTDGNWILNSGNDAQALDPAVVIAANGTIFLDAGDNDGTIAEDGSQIVWAIPVTAEQGGLVFEARIAVEDITGCSVNIGLTEATTLAEPFSIGGGDTIVSNASDAVCFVFDDGADIKRWFALGVAGDTEATGNTETASAPVNGEFQTLRCEIDADGDGATFYVDGVLVGTLTADVVTKDTDVYFMCVINGDGGNTGGVGLTVDYMYVAHTR